MLNVLHVASFVVKCTPFFLPLNEYFAISGSEVVTGHHKPSSRNCLIVLLNTINSNTCPHTLKILSIPHAVLELRLLAIDEGLLPLGSPQSGPFRQTGRGLT